MSLLSCFINLLSTGAKSCCIFFLCPSFGSSKISLDACFNTFSMISPLSAYLPCFDLLKRLALRCSFLDSLEVNDSKTNSETNSFHNKKAIITSKIKMRGLK